MKKLKHLKKLSRILDESLNEINDEIAQIKKEHQKLILLSNSNLISEIAKGEGLDEITLIDKYLKKTKKKIVESTPNKLDLTRKEELLSHITFNGEDYFYEDKTDGNVYNSESNKVGIFKSGSIEFDEV